MTDVPQELSQQIEIEEKLLAELQSKEVGWTAAVLCLMRCRASW